MHISSGRSILCWMILALSVACDGVDSVESVESLDQRVPAKDGLVAANHPQKMLCQGESCEGQDPETMGCLYNAVTPAGAEKEIVDAWSGDVLGYVRMRYSADCDAQWGEVDNYSDLELAKVALRTLDGETLSEPVFSDDAWIWTTMTETPNAGYRVDGAIEACVEGCDSGGYSWVVW